MNINDNTNPLLADLKIQTKPKFKTNIVFYVQHLGHRFNLFNLQMSKELAIFNRSVASHYLVYNHTTA